MLATMRLLGLVVLWLALAVASGPAWAVPHRSGSIVAQAESVQPLGAVLKRIGQRYPGRALDAQLNEREDPPVYRVKWLGDDGKVREVTADARTGRILDVR
ncbi:MAG: PepSY domain-containing protein [Geminicoccaceae bacterium]